MATRQYIGARYVPKFADPIDWNESMTYEPLTIVNYLGASYTSKKIVYAGIAPTNSEYWALTGNYNAQVEQYRQEVESLVDNVEAVEQIAANMNYLHGKRILIFGDSISDQESASVQTLRPNWVDRLEAKVPSDAYIDNQFSLAGRFITGSAGIANLMQTIDPADMACDIMVIFAGINDFRHSVAITDGTDNTYSTLKGALGIIANKIRSYCPYANVFVVSPLRNYETEYPEGHKADQPLSIYRACMHDWASQQGFTYIDGYGAPMLNPAYTATKNLYQPDGIHPNSTYSPLLCEYIYNKILTNSGVAPVKETVRVNAASFCEDGITATFAYFDVDSNGYCHIIATVSGSFTANTAKTIMKIPAHFTPASSSVQIVNVASSGNVSTATLILSSTLSDGKSNVTVTSPETITGSVAIDYWYKPRAMNSVNTVSL